MRVTSLRPAVIASLAGLVLLAPIRGASATDSANDGFHVAGRHLVDRCGERVVLRGVNKMIVWTDPDGVPSCREIARTGANAVRMVWLMERPPDELDAAIAHCAAAGLIPMVELHDGIGDWSMLPALVDWWTRPDVLAVIDRHRRVLLINIGNEVGDATVTPQMFRAGYEAAVLRMRAAGIHVPLIIDGTDWGKDVDVLQSEGPSLIAADPDHNLLFSVHMWWPAMWGYTEQRVIAELEQSAAMELPLIVGEFGNRWDQTAAGRIPYLAIVEHTHRLGIGMLAWEWGPGNHPQTWLDMTSEGTFDTLFGWGLEVAVTDEFSIANTAVRPASAVTGHCLPVRVRSDAQGRRSP